MKEIKEDVPSRTKRYKTRINIQKGDQTLMKPILNKWHDLCLFSCFVNGEPSVALCDTTFALGDEATIRPMYVRVTPGMVLTDHDGTQPEVRP